MSNARLVDVLEEVLARNEDLSAKTVRAYRYAVRRFAALTGISTVSALAKATPRTLQAALDRARRDGTYKPSSVRLAFTVAKKLARHLVREEQLATSPFHDLEPIRVGDNVPRWNVLLPDELEKVLAALPAGSIDRVVFTWLGGLGLRVNELLELRFGDLSQEKTRWVVRFVGKGKRSFAMAVPPEARAALEAWWRVVDSFKGRVPSRPDDALLADLDGEPLQYRWVYEMVKRVSKLHAGHSITPHGLRASYITRLARQKGLVAAQKMARHTTLRMTQRYVRGEEVLDENAL